MTLGLAFLVIFIPLITMFIAANFAVISGYLETALAYLSSVPAIAQSLWSVMPAAFTSFAVSVLVIVLSVQLLRRIID